MYSPLTAGSHAGAGYQPRYTSAATSNPSRENTAGAKTTAGKKKPGVLKELSKREHVAKVKSAKEELHPPPVFASIPKEPDAHEEMEKIKKESPGDYYLLTDLHVIRAKFDKLQGDVEGTVTTLKQRKGKTRNLRTFTTALTGGEAIDDDFLYTWMDKVEDLKDEFKKGDHYDEEWSDEVKMEHHQHKLRQLERLHAFWACVTPEIIGRIVLMLGESSGRFFRCLSVHMSSKMRSDYPQIFNRISQRTLQFPNLGLRYAPGEFQQCNDIGDLGEDDEEFWEGLAPKGGKRPPWWQFWHGQQKKEVCFYWGGIPHVLTRKSTENMNVLSKVPYTGEIYKSPTGQAMLAYNWSRIQHAYWMDRVTDAIALGMLMYMAHRVVFGFLPQPQNVAILLLINAYGCFNCGIEMVMRLRCLSSYGVFNMIPGVGTVLSLLLQIFLMVINLKLFHDAWQIGDPEDVRENTAALDDSIFKKSPLIFSMMIMAQWGSLMVAILAWEPAGMTVLPAFRAMISAESLRFLIFQMLFVAMATHAYYALPLSNNGFEIDNAGKLGRGLISFFRMFRLNILGDFDFFELEGVDPTMTGSVNKTTGVLQTAVLDEQPEDFPSIHRDLRLLVTVLVFTFQVVMMNMYIGVLGHKYDDFKESVELIYASTKSEVIGRFLLRQEFWSCCPCFKCLWPDPLEGYEDSDEEPELPRITKNMSLDFVKNAIPKAKDCNGTWIVVPDKNKVAETEDELQSVKTYVQSLNQDMHEMQHKLDRVLDALAAKNR